MKLIHTMIRVKDLQQSIDFYTNALGMKINKQKDYESGKFTLVFLGYGDIETSHQIELTYNWDQNDYDMGTAFGHLALGHENIFQLCEKLRAKGVKITREPAEMKHGGSTIAFIEDPNGYKIELVQI